MKKVFAFVSLFALGLSSAIGLNLFNNQLESKEVDATPVLVTKTATIDYKSDTITGYSNSSTYYEHRYVYDFNGTSVYFGGKHSVQSSSFAVRKDVSILGNIDPSFDAKAAWKDKIPNDAIGAIPGAINQIKVTLLNDTSVSRGLTLYLGTSQINRDAFPEGLSFYGTSESGTGYTYEPETRTYTIPVDSENNYTYFAFNQRTNDSYTGILSIEVSFLGETEDPVVQMNESELVGYTESNAEITANYYNLLGTGVNWTQASSDGGEVTLGEPDNTTPGVSVINVTLKKAGTVIITATDNNGTASASCAVTINPSIISITKDNIRATDPIPTASKTERYEGSGRQGEYDIYVHDTKIYTSQLTLGDNSGYIYNETPFDAGIKMLKVTNTVEGRKYTVEFANSEITNKGDGIAGTKVRLGNDEYWIPVSHSTHFRLDAGNNGALFRIDAIEVYEESLAAKAFAEMYLNAYTCNDNGASLPTLNGGYTYDNMEALYNALDGDSQDRLVNATINHTDEYGTDVIKEYGQRYYLIVYNHGAAGYDFMDLVGAGSITPHGSERSILSNITNENTPIYIVSFIVVISAISISGLFISKRRKER